VALTGTGQVWADALMSALGVSFAGLTSGEEAMIRAYWKNLCDAHISHITSNSLINTLVTGVTGTGPDGGPLPIVSQPGEGAIL